VRRDGLRFNSARGCLTGREEIKGRNRNDSRRLYFDLSASGGPAHRISASSARPRCAGLRRAQSSRARFTSWSHPTKCLFSRGNIVHGVEPVGVGRRVAQLVLAAEGRSSQLFARIADGRPQPGLTPVMADLHRLARPALLVRLSQNGRRHGGATGGSFGPPVPMPLGAGTKTLAGQSPRQWHPKPAIFE
jgi:hypothetical protein